MANDAPVVGPDAPTANSREFDCAIVEDLRNPIAPTASPRPGKSTAPILGEDAHAPMHFAYQGFTQERDIRSFTFWGIERNTPTITFLIEIDLPLLLVNRVPMQDAPMFCLGLLTTASLAGTTSLERFRKYRVLERDLRPLLVDREKRAAEKAKKKPPSRPVRKPGSISSIHLASPVQSH